MPEERGAVLLHLVTVALAELLRKLSAVTDFDDPLLRVLAQEEGWEGLCHGHRLTMAGRHEYHQPLCDARHDVFQLSTHQVEVSGSFPPACMDELDIICIVSSRQLIPGFGGYGFLQGRRDGASTPGHPARHPCGQGLGAPPRSVSPSGRSSRHPPG